MFIILNNLELENMAYHLGLEKIDLKGAKIAFLPGDPFRVPAIAAEVVKRVGGTCRELAWKREFRTFLIDEQIVVTSTGIGGPSAAIAMEELAMLGVDTYIRIGTTGAIQEYIDVGDLIVTSGSLRMDGASLHYAPVEYPAVANHEMVAALASSAKDITCKCHVGITASTDTFYPGQERQDSFGKKNLRRFNGQTEEFKNLNILNYEMESSTLLTLASVFGLRCGVVAGVVVNRSVSESIDDSKLAVAESNSIRCGVGALKYIL